VTKWFIQDEVVYTGRKNRFAPTLQPGANVAVAAIVSNLQGCKCFANLETRIQLQLEHIFREIIILFFSVLYLLAIVHAIGGIYHKHT
jgi:hypothetical protein